VLFPSHDLFGEQNQEFGAFGRRSQYRSLTIDPQVVPKSGHILFTVPMKSQRAMLTKSIGEAIYNTNPAYIGDLEAGLYMDFAHTIARRQCLYWYANQNDSYAICEVSSGAWVTRSATEDTFQFQTSNEAIERFNENDMLNFVYKTDPDGGGSIEALDDINTAYIAYVTAVDISSNTVEVQFINSSGTIGTGSGGANAITTPPDTALVQPWRTDADHTEGTFDGIAGINSYLRSSGNLLGDDNVGTSGQGTIALDEHPQFRSVEKAVNGSLTMEVLRRWMGLALRASRRLGYAGIDIAFTTEGVLRTAVNEMQAYSMNTAGGPMGGTLQADGDVGYTFSIGGKTMSIQADPWVDSGTLYATHGS
jgi:hypothetical protein